MCPAVGQVAQQYEMPTSLHSPCLLAAGCMLLLHTCCWLLHTDGCSPGLHGPSSAHQGGESFSLLGVGWGVGVMKTEGNWDAVLALLMYVAQGRLLWKEESSRACLKHMTSVFCCSSEMRGLAKCQRTVCKQMHRWGFYFSCKGELQQLCSYLFSTCMTGLQ